MLSYIDYETAVLAKLCKPSTFEEVPEPEDLVAAKKKAAFLRQTYWQVSRLLRLHAAHDPTSSPDRVRCC
jgi:hypothetical protein